MTETSKTKPARRGRRARTAELDWTIHPGVHWREAMDESGRSQADVATEMGVSQKHLSQILNCHVIPGLDATMAFTKVLELPPTMFWRMACDYRIALVMGKKDLTSEYL
jgi:transcriptional regulator with XRE-family HTH domain